MAKKDDTLNIHEAAAELKMSVTTLRRRIAAGVIKPRPTSPTLMRPAAFEFDRAEVERYIKANS